MTPIDRFPTPTEGIQQLDDWLPYQCSIITNRVSAMLKRMYADELGIGVTEWRLLANLAAHAPLSAKELGGHTAMDQVAITRAVSLLVKKKLVTRREDSADRRKVVLRLSKSGVAAYESVAPLARSIEAELTSRISSEQIKQLHDLLATLVETANESLGDGRDWRELALKRPRRPRRNRASSVAVTE